jgi:hypothetical protein
MAEEENKNELVKYEIIPEEAMQEAWMRSEGQLEDPAALRAFLKKIKEGMFAAASAMKAYLNQISNTSKQMKTSNIVISAAKISEAQLGTGELTPGNAVNVVAPAKEREKFDPGVSTRRGGGR